MQKIKAVAYARYSSDKQQESSIVVQLGAIHRFCEMHNIELIHEYIDEAQTGTNANRKEFQEMIQEAPKREFRFVIVHRMDRWARNVDDARHYKKLLSKYGVKVISALEEFDETPEGEFFELLSMGMAELYSKKLARESLAGVLANAREGKVHGGMPPLGYTVKNKKYVIDEQEAEAVKIIFDLVKQYKGYTYIRDYLNNNGYRRSDGRMFTAHFTDILQNRMYIGEYVFNRMDKRRDGKRNYHREKPESEIIRISGGVPQIIDEKTFYAVQGILNERRHGMAISRIENREYQFAGMIKCRLCGYALSGTKTHSHGLAYVQYVCGSKGARIKCSVKALREDYLEGYIYRLFTKCLLYGETLDGFCELVRSLYIREYDKLKEDFERINARIEAINNDIEQSRLEMQSEDYGRLRVYNAEIIATKERERRELTYERQVAEERIVHFPKFNTKKVARSATAYHKALEENKDNPRKIWLELINRIVVDNDYIRVVINVNRLIGTELPITLTVLEKRDNVALKNEWKHLPTTFQQVTVEVA